MKKHTNAIRILRTQLKDLTAEKRRILEEIRKLKEAGPATGPERSGLRWGYNYSTRWKARANHLASGLLRGVPYVAMEKKSDEAPPCHAVYKTIQAAFGEDEALKAEWTLERVTELLKRDSVASQEAA
jgi:hypothetical protein